MFRKDRKALDAFSFSLGGMTTVSSFVAVPVIANDRLNKIRDEHVRRAMEAQDDDKHGLPEVQV